MPDELIMRGQTATGLTETLNFSGHTPGYAYRLVDFQIYPSTSIGAQHYEMTGSVTAGKTAVDPDNPNFDDPGLIATGVCSDNASEAYPHSESFVINDLFYITQDLILMVKNITGDPVNWQCKFEKVKLSTSAEAVANFNQFTIYDG